MAVTRVSAQGNGDAQHRARLEDYGHIFFSHQDLLSTWETFHPRDRFRLLAMKAQKSGFLLRKKVDFTTREGVQ